MINFLYDENIYKTLKHLDWFYDDTAIAWRAENKFSPEVIERVQINEWQKYNNYFYFFDSMKDYNVYNLINYSHIFKGVIFTPCVYDLDDFKILENYCIANNLKIILITEVKLDDVHGICET